MSANLRLILPFDFSNNCAMNTLPSEGTTRHENQAFRSKDFALEPCNKKPSHQRLQNQMHKDHILLNPNAKFPQKRKFDQYMNGDKFATTLAFIAKEKCGNRNAILNEKMEYYNICRQDYTPGLNPMKQRQLKALESLVNEDFDNSNENSHSFCSKNEDVELNQPQNNLSFKDNHISRPVIPVGPRFQAEVPKWEGRTNVRHHNIDGDLKLLGIQLWLMPNISENKTKDIGEGRCDSCSCEFPGSVDCVKLHIREARELLKLEIGTTFSSWKFDEMGEDVSKSWALEEQKKFESLVRLNISNGINLWKLIMKHLPSKSMKCIINYYHNVYIPRRLSMETRSSHDVVDSDNDQDENL